MKCPIAWTQKDGPFPCAFLQNRSECMRTDSARKKLMTQISKEVHKVV